MEAARLSFQDGNRLPWTVAEIVQGNDSGCSYLGLGRAMHMPTEDECWAERCNQITKWLDSDLRPMPGPFGPACSLQLGWPFMQEQDVRAGQAGNLGQILAAIIGCVPGLPREERPPLAWPVEGSGAVNAAQARHGQGAEGSLASPAKVFKVGLQESSIRKAGQAVPGLMVAADEKRGDRPWFLNLGIGAQMPVLFRNGHEGEILFVADGLRVADLEHEVQGGVMGKAEDLIPEARPMPMYVAENGYPHQGSLVAFRASSFSPSCWTSSSKEGSSPRNIGRMAS